MGTNIIDELEAEGITSKSRVLLGEKDLVALTRSIENLPSQLFRLCYLRLGCDEDYKLKLGILPVLPGPFQGAVLVAGVGASIDGEHFGFGN